jgi:hypothetical protein
MVKRGETQSAWRPVATRRSSRFGIVDRDAMAEGQAAPYVSAPARAAFVRGNSTAPAR